ncbi:hypothetical protein [Cohnella yongneupensis]|uniref:Uncharacterized protein n=1 Tax=Cohnella yongneupensis TaxID=425006 RepID=A0ABW0R574_9BACL
MAEKKPETKVEHESIIFRSPSGHRYELSFSDSGNPVTKYLEPEPAASDEK